MFSLYGFEVWCRVGGVVVVGLVAGCVRVNPMFAADDGSGATEGVVSSTRGADDTGRPGSGGSATTSDETGTTQGRGESTTGVTAGDTGPVSSTSGTTGIATDICSTFKQDCPEEGEKCMPHSDDPAAAWDSLGCFPIVRDPDTPGDECSISGPPYSGFDTCDGTSMCWGLDPESNTGTCVPFCAGSPGNPLCDEPNASCLIANEGVIAVCLPNCDPLLQDCDEGQACVPANGGFVCAPDASMGDTEIGDPCEFINECAPGYLCVSGEAVGCDGPSCCTQFCYEPEPADCPKPYVCVPYFENGDAPDGLENVGVCVE